MSSKMLTSEMSSDMADIEEAVDPRVQIELEKLNNATDEINKLEVDLDEARAGFRQLLMDSTRRIDELAKKLGSCIEKARPYYEARLKAKEALQETQQAAVRFERANSAHAAAKEMVFLAEEGLKAEGRTFDHAWQEMLNHATMRVNESELERTLGEAEHRRTSMLYHDAETRVQHLQKDLKRAIAKSSLIARRSLLQLNSIASRHQLHLLPYFEMKAQSNLQLENQKSRVKALERQVAQSKLCYSRALGNLEKISDEIHQIRRDQQAAVISDDLGARVAGVGAESSPSRQATPAKQLNNTDENRAKLPPPLGVTETWSSRSSYDDEFLGLPATLGPAASPVMQPVAADSETPEYLGLTQLANTPSFPPSSNSTAPSRSSEVNRRSSDEVNRRSSECTELVTAKAWAPAPGSSSERVRELLSQGMMMLNISSFAERISNNTPPSSSQGTPARRRSSGSVHSRKVPSPLERNLLYLSAAAEDESASDSESLASVEMLTDEQVASLMLDRQQDDDLLSETDEEPLLGPACRALSANNSSLSTPTAAVGSTVSPSKLTPATTHPLLANP